MLLRGISSRWGLTNTSAPIADMAQIIMQECKACRHMEITPPIIKVMRFMYNCSLIPRC